MLRLLPILALLIILAAAMRDDFALTLVYLFVGAAVAGSWWSTKALAKVQTERKIASHAFLGEVIRVQINIHNRGWLPLPWINLTEELPVGLSTSPAFSRVTHLPAGVSAKYEFNLEARKRGFYPIGPLVLSTGDILGLHEPLEQRLPADYLTVYPKMIPLNNVRLPSRSPQGTLPHSQPIFEDPARIFGKRDYTSGDSMRRVDWKASASSGRLQVRVFEPSIALECFLFLDLNQENYPQRGRIDASELAIVIAASLAGWITSKRQAVGLLVNGKDPLGEYGQPLPLPPEKGQAHLMRLLEVMARVELAEALPLAGLIQQQRFHLAWGSSLIVISGQASEELLDELYKARQAGQNALLVIAGPSPDNPQMTRRAAQFGIQMICITNERDLEPWRR